METQQALATLGSIIAFAGFLALLNERFNELFVMPMVDGTRFEPYKAHIALALGTAGAVVAGVDFLTPLAELFGVALASSWFGLVVSGIIIGSGSNLLHDLVGSWAGGHLEVFGDVVEKEGAGNNTPITNYEYESHVAESVERYLIEQKEKEAEIEALRRAIERNNQPQ